MDTPIPVSSRDRLYIKKHKKVADFEFNEAVTEVFEDMVRRSVPGYDAIVEISGVIAANLHRELGRPLYCVDLGCSRGAVTKSLLDHLSSDTHRFDAIDSSPAMISAAQGAITDRRVKFHSADVRSFPLDSVDLVVMNLVLQFLPPEQRLTMLTRIREGLSDDGIFILTEKVVTDQKFVDIHREFKRSRGYSQLEIQQKRDALEKVMQIDTKAVHLARLQEAGFSQVSEWFSLLNWVSFIAKP